MLNFYIASEFLYTTPHRTAYMTTKMRCRTAHVTAKMRCGAVMVLAKLYTTLHYTYDQKNEVRCGYDFS